MNAGTWRIRGRWRIFADSVVLALGINVWASVILFPALFVGAWQEPAARIGATAPLVLLALGLWRRSEVVLLLAFPTALLLAFPQAPAIVSPHIYGGTRFFIVAVGLVTYVLGTAFFTSLHEPPPPRHVRSLASSRRPVPPRWKRRFRIYGALTVLSAVFPGTLLYAVNFYPGNRRFLQEMYPGRVESMTVFLNLLVIGGWIALFSIVFMGILRPHRTGDRELIVELARLGAQVNRGRPRPVFYVGITAALAFMIGLLIVRYL